MNRFPADVFPMDLDAALAHSQREYESDTSIVVFHDTDADVVAFLLKNTPLAKYVECGSSDVKGWITVSSRQGIDSLGAAIAALSTEKVDAAACARSLILAETLYGMYENADDYGLVNSFDLLEVNRVLRFSPPITPNEFAAHTSVASYGRFSVESILACAASQDRPKKRRLW